ncbi:MAG: TIGR03936 family radical SAM-associated protein [Eubacterium sp.]|nr:TIGR03936 family radical SAM-associated protein [Eubacterium sp.]
MKIRIKFRKYGVMKFIGHLDVMRFFQKAVRRSGIEICYTEGFSPHQIMSFAAPLGVGITSDGEYVDLEVHTSMPSAQAIQALNSVMPKGMEITGYVRLPDNAKTAMSVVAAADYEVWYKQEYAMPEELCDWKALQQKLHVFYNEPEQVLITKKTKKSEKVMDLKQLVYDFRILEPEGRFLERPAFYLNVCTGSTDNVKPELVLEAFYTFLGLAFDPFAVQIHRRDVYYMDASGKRLSLLCAGKAVEENESLK